MMKSHHGLNTLKINFQGYRKMYYALKNILKIKSNKNDKNQIKINYSSNKIN